MKKNNTHLNLPYNFDFLIIKKKKKNFYFLICYDNNTFVKFFLNLDNKYFQINKDTNTLILKNYTSVNNIFEKNLFFQKLKSFTFIFFLKVKFKGKGYKIKYYKKNKLMFFFFNRAHLTLIKFNKINLIKLGKYKFILSCYDLNFLKNTSKKIIKIRKINIFTLRGLRLSKQIVFKRKGKKSSYS